MYVVSIRDNQGRGISEVDVSGDKISLEPGQRVYCNTRADTVTSLVREGDKMTLFHNNVFSIHIENFFSTSDVALQFSDKTYTPEEVQALLLLHVCVSHADRIERLIEASPGSQLQVLDGDSFEFINTQVHPEDLHRYGNDLKVFFHLDDDSQKYNLVLTEFFDTRLGAIKPPVVFLADKEHHATDMFVQPQRQVFQWHGAPPTIATAGVLYAFYFSILSYDPDKFRVDVLLDGEDIPAWLSLNYLGAGKFALTGIPPDDFEGTSNVEINVQDNSKSVAMHTQQAYQLMISGKSELSERAAVGGVMQAEVRGAVATQSAESFAASSQAAASSSASMALVAAVASLSVVTIATAQQLEEVSFGAFDVDVFLGDGFDLTYGFKSLGFDTAEGDDDSEASSFGMGARDQDLTEDFQNEDVLDDDQGKEDRRDIETTSSDARQAAESQQGGGAGDSSGDELSGDLVIAPDEITVPESVVFNLPFPGLLNNDINTQFGKLAISKVGGKSEDLGKEVLLPSGAKITIFADGGMTYNPNGAWETLAQGDFATDTFFYRAGNGTNFGIGNITFTIIGENDAPVIVENQMFNIEENTDNGTLVGSIDASDIDNADIINYTEVFPGGTTAFTIIFSDGRIFTADKSQLDFEATPTFNIDVVVTDLLGASDTETITINLIDVNEKPTINNDTFDVDEDVANGTSVDTISTASDPDTSAPFNTLSYSIIAGNTGDTFEIDSNTGEITVDDNTILNFESNPTFVLTVKVEDGPGLSDTASITINLNDVNEKPNINNDTFDVDENVANGTSVDTISTASDPDNDAPFNTLSYSIIAGNTGDTFEIDSNTGEITVDDNTILNFESNPTFVLTVQVEDGPGLTDTAFITINLNDVNEAPMGNDDLFNIDENEPNGTFVGIVTASDPDTTSPFGDIVSFSITGGNIGNAFDIDNNGEITINNENVINFENNPVFNLTVEVEDGGGLTDTADITITLNDLPEPLMAFSGENLSGVVAETLSYDDLSAAISVSVDAWMNAGYDVPDFSVVISDLDDGVLGVHLGDIIYIDANAANYAWNTNLTYSPDAGEMDLLTVLNHEIGHMLGMNHDDSELMDDVLASGDSFLDFSEYDSKVADDYDGLENILATQLLELDAIEFDSGGTNNYNITESVYDGVGSGGMALYVDFNSADLDPQDTSVV